MIVLDANLLLYAYASTSLHHDQAREWVAAIFSGEELVGLPWQTIHAFLRIATDTRISQDRFSMPAVLAIVQQWIDLPHVRLLSPGEQHWTLLRTLLIHGQAKGPLTTDAQLAAITMEYGGVLHTTDRDFARFPGLRWQNPLTPRKSS
jgi:toxin-antitoxin system PIN domain toxin